MSLHDLCEAAGLLFKGQVSLRSKRSCFCPPWIIKVSSLAAGCLMSHDSSDLWLRERLPSLDRCYNPYSK